MIEAYCAENDHIGGIVELTNRARVTWPLYFPEPLPEQVEQFIQMADTFPAMFDATILVQDDTLVGFVGVSNEYCNTTLKICHNALIIVDVNLPPFVRYAVMCKIVDVVYRYAKITECHRISWSLGTGAWTVIQKIIERKYPTKQTGVVLTTEIT